MRWKVPATSPLGASALPGRSWIRDRTPSCCEPGCSATTPGSCMPSTAGRIIGDPTEAALVVVAEKAGLRHEQETAHHPRLEEIPFSSERKRMTTVHLDGRSLSPTSKERRTIILPLITLPAGERTRIVDAAAAMERDALRVLALARRVTPGDGNNRRRDRMRARTARARRHDRPPTTGGTRSDPPLPGSRHPHHHGHRRQRHHGRGDRTRDRPTSTETRTSSADRS